MILTDMRMPGRDGSELIQILQNMPDREFEYVIPATRMRMKRLKHINVTDVTLMRKPIDIEALMILEDRTFVKQ